MAISNSVQFRSSERLIDAYKQVGIPAFSISSGSQLLYAWNGKKIDEGEDLLRSFLDLLSESQSTARYTLRVHDLGNKPVKIDNKTPYHGSYNFTLMDQQINGVMNWPASYQGSTGIEMAKKVLSLEEKVDKILTALEPGEEENEPLAAQPPLSVTDRVLSGLEPMIPRIAEVLVTKLLGVPVAAATAVNGPTATAPSKEDFTDAQAQVIFAQCKRLRAHYPEVWDLLRKLADFADKAPDQFKLYASAM